MPLKLGFTLPEMGLSDVRYTGWIIVTGGDVSRQWPTHQNALFVWTFVGWLDIGLHPEFFKGTT